MVVERYQILCSPESFLEGGKASVFNIAGDRRNYSRSSAYDVEAIGVKCIVFERERNSRFPRTQSQEQEKLNRPWPLRQLLSSSTLGC